MYLLFLALVTFEEDGDTGRPADIYAVGFQEIVDLNASNIMAARYIILLLLLLIILINTYNNN